MKLASTFYACLLASVAASPGGEEWLDRIDEALTVSAFHENVRLRLSGTLDLEGYFLQQPPPGLLFTRQHALFNPRLTLFLDGQLGARVYLFAQARADRGFDPSDRGARLRLDEYALRLTPWEDGRLNLQVGQFATVVGNWAARHGSWENPFITAPGPYENLTGIWDSAAVPSFVTLLRWAHVRPFLAGEYADKNLRNPIIWGPNYTTGAAVFGRAGKLDYAAEIKNASLSSRPEYWSVTEAQWQHPTVSARLGFRPNQMWHLGVSGSVGSYLESRAAGTLAPGHKLDDYREIVFGQDVAFAWHHWQLWAEFYETRFAIPMIGNADTFAYYVEAKYKFTPQLFGALRWNQQLFSRIDSAVVSQPADLTQPPVSRVESHRWGRDLWRIDAALGYRFTPHTQLKLQYSLQHEDAGPRDSAHLLGVQFTLRF